MSSVYQLRSCQLTSLHQTLLKLYLLRKTNRFVEWLPWKTWLIVILCIFIQQKGICLVMTYTFNNLRNWWKHRDWPVIRRISFLPCFKRRLQISTSVSQLCNHLGRLPVRLRDCRVQKSVLLICWCHLLKTYRKVYLLQQL